MGSVGKGTQLSMSSTATERVPLKIIIAGAPAAGKGTQCEIITKEFGVVHLSTGDILRAAVKAGTPLGVRAKEFMDGGQLVPDDLITGVVCDRLAEEDCRTRGWLLDGFPRTRPQADSLTEAGYRPDSFILLDVPEDILVERVTGRRTDPVTGAIYHLTFKPPPADIVDRLVQRSDDTKEKIVVRYREFLKHVDSVKDCYEGKCLKVDGSLSQAEVTNLVVAGLQEAEKRSAASRAKMLLFQRVVAIASLVGIDKGMGRALAAARVPFPSSLAGMLSLFAAMQGVQVVCPPGSDMVAKFYAPAVALIKAWLPALFVPPLVILPLKRHLLGSPAQAILLLGIVLSGAVLSLSSSALVAESLRKVEGSLRMRGIMKSSRTEASPAGATSSPPAAADVSQVPAKKSHLDHTPLTPEQLTLALPRLPGPRAPLLFASLVLCRVIFAARFAAPGTVSPADRAFGIKLYGIYATMASYLSAQKLSPQIKKVAHPVLVTALLTFGAHAGLSLATAVPLSQLLAGYYGSVAGSGAGDLVSSALGAAIVSFGMQLYTYRSLMYANSLRVLGTTVFSAVFGLASSAVLVRAAGVAPAQTALALLTRCITTPLALSGAALTGADASVSALVVVLTGLLGASAGNALIEAVVAATSSTQRKAAVAGNPAPDQVSAGLAMGAAAHGLGAAAVAAEPIKFASAIVAMSLTGVWTVALLAVPAVRAALVRLALGA